VAGILDSSAPRGPETGLARPRRVRGVSFTSGPRAMAGSPCGTPDDQLPHLVGLSTALAMAVQASQLLPDRGASSKAR